jgi:anaerobic selenocysteine-containing dehydrogenase
MLIFAVNPLLSTPGGARLEEALATLEWCVAVDMYVTETTRHANVILPPVSPLERSGIDVVMRCSRCVTTSATAGRGAQA